MTAVGKIFKPALRDLAIKEKVRLETARVCGPDASAAVDVPIDGQQADVVEISSSRRDGRSRSPNWRRR